VETEAYLHESVRLNQVFFWYNSSSGRCFSQFVGSLLSPQRVSGLFAGKPGASTPGILKKGESMQYLEAVATAVLAVVAVLAYVQGRKTK